jgi:hypothetical protein
MAWPIFGGFFLYTEHAPTWLQVAFWTACAIDAVWGALK